MTDEPKTRYTSEIQAMMYTFGDVRTPLPSSAHLIEQIIRKQLVDIIIQAAHVTQNVRNARSLTAEDVIFIIRRDPVKVSRLKEFLSWKDLRKNAKPGEEGGGGGNGGIGTAAIVMDGADEELIGMVQFEGITGSEGGIAATTTTTPLNNGQQTTISTTRSKLPKRKQAKLPWDLIAGMVVEATGGEIDLLEDEPPDIEAEADVMKRLHAADRLTMDMTREEYMEYSECRQASFTYKKAKKFRDWLNPAQYIDLRLNDDVIEILGFLSWEMVRRLTETAMEIKRRWGSTDDEGPRIGENFDCNLFCSPTEKTAITPEHLHAAVIQIDQDNSNPYQFLLCSPNHRRRRLRLF